MKSTSQRWYDQNKDTYNEIRRQRYATDKERRKKAREQAKAYRDKVRAGKAGPDTGPVTRLIDGKEVQVFTTGQVSQELNRSPQMLRNWEKRGILPESTFPGRHRLYTKGQVGLIDIIDSAMFAKPFNQDTLDKVVAQVKENWNGA